jgi:hypothetical protein
MATVGGSIESVGIRGRTFAVAADADGSRDIGGFTNEVQPNGDGTARLVKTRKPWMIEGLTLAVNDDRGDQEFLQEIEDGNDFVAIDITFASGSTWQGSGIVTGDLKYSGQNGTAEVVLSGEGVLTQQ